MLKQLKILFDVLRFLFSGVEILLTWKEKKKTNNKTNTAQSAGAVEYTDWTSAEK